MFSLCLSPQQAVFSSRLMLCLLAHFKHQSFMCVCLYHTVKLQGLHYTIYLKEFAYLFVHTIYNIGSKIFIKDADIKQTFFQVFLCQTPYIKLHISTHLIRFSDIKRTSAFCLNILKNTKAFFINSILVRLIKELRERK